MKMTIKILMFLRGFRQCTVYSSQFTVYSSQCTVKDGLHDD